MKPHRADIRRSDGLVIELQHSSISDEEVAAREAFYGNMWWLFDVRSNRARIHITRRGNGLWTVLPLNYRGKYDAITKPMFWDLGGPVLAFQGPFRPSRFNRSGCAQLLSRAEFVERAALNPLTADERTAFSHYVSTPRPVVADDHGKVYFGLAPPNEDDETQARMAKAGLRAAPGSSAEITIHRCDGTFDDVER
jgi:hypothetical protein